MTCDHSGLGLQVVAIFYLWEKTQHFPKVMNSNYLIPDFYYYYCDFQHLGSSCGTWFFVFFPLEANKFRAKLDGEMRDKMANAESTIQAQSHAE